VSKTPLRNGGPAARVAVIPGAAFGSNDHVRISYATSMERLQEGIRRIGVALQKLP